MKYYTFDIIIEKEPDDPGYFAYSSTLPGCFSNGMTIEETKANMQEAIQQHIECLKELGKPIPQKKNIIQYSELMIGVAE